MSADRLKNVFPPQPDHEHEWAALEGMLACAVEGREADYVSTPITTGTRFMDWYHNEGSKLQRGSDAYKRAHEEQVIACNSLHARQFVEQLRTRRRIIIEPTSLEFGHWTQNDYRHLWGKVIERYARRVWLLDGWQYSSGCAFEFYVASRSGIETLSETSCFISRQQGAEMIEAAIADIATIGQSTDFLQAVVATLHDIRHVEVEVLPKDETLNRLADSHNVAQFVSFEPGDQPAQRFCRIMGVPTSHRFSSVEDAIAKLFNNSIDGSVNVRSFRPGDTASHPFEYGLQAVEDAAGFQRKLANDGLHTIVNETIDIHDGGVSGVLADNLVEFSPDDTPRCVEKQGTAKLPLAVAETILDLIYGFRPQWDREPTRRVEFSIHPQKRGVRHDHTIIWEIGPLGDAWPAPHAPGSLQIGGWPNRFSRVLGDKTYGLLLAHAIGFAVPYTTVFNSRVAPFTFGRRTGAHGSWLRTAPAVNELGRYPTRYFGEQDLSDSADELEPLQGLLQYLEDCVPLLSWTAFTVLQQHSFSPRRNPPQAAEDDGFDVAAAITAVKLPSVLAQQSVPSEWSGSLNTEQTGPRIEGVRGFGDRFMMGQQKKEKLPEAVHAAILQVQQQLEVLFGPISMEWAYDGETVWVLQLHQELTPGSENVIMPGEAKKWHEFEVQRGLEILRELTEMAAQRGDGIEFDESVGSTSHAAAIVRKKGVPARVKSEP